MHSPQGEGKPTLAIVGAGRAGSALAVAAARAGYAVVAVASRTGEHAAAVARDAGATVVESPVQAMRRAGLTLLTVPDTALTRIAATAAATGASLRGRGVVHCAARFSPEIIAALRLTGASVGVLHPLQAMAGGDPAPDFAGAWFRVDAPDPLRGRLLDLVRALHGSPLEVPASSAAVYHAAAVLAGTAPLALLAEATALLEAAGVPRDDAHSALAALLSSAARNARRLGPAAALTGPVARGDHAAIAAHLDALAGHPEVRALYLHLTRAMESLAGTATVPPPAIERIA